MCVAQVRLPQRPGPHPERMLAERKPPWLKVPLPGGERHGRLKRRFRELGLATVCEEARCPNIGECWEQGTATLMLLGDVCTRGCRFCAVTSGRPPALDPHEPNKVGTAVAEMLLAYVVLTMVDRDDLPDGGAGHVAAAVQAIREKSPDTLVETLVSDFAGRTKDVARLLQQGRPDVFAHNVEVVPRLQRSMRDARCSFERSLSVLQAARDAGAQVTKSSLMVGCGEQDDEVPEALHALRQAGVDVVTIGQYLRPSEKHAPVVRYVEPEAFARWQAQGEAMGFKYVASGPLVRSSYRAAEAFLHGILRGTDAPYSDRYGKRRLQIVS